jgi:thiamine-monophosphate kinase
MRSTLPNILGKEFVCINKIIKKLPVQSIGDDCAVLAFGGKNLLLTVDTFSDKVHFDTKYFSLKEIGERCAEAAISDIAAMGGKPLYMALSLATPNHTSIHKLIDGVKSSLLRHGIVIVGGDTTYSKILSISMTVIGLAAKPVYRSGAKINDVVYITGHTGLSMAGLYAIKKKISGFKTLKDAHKSPRANIKKGLIASKHANSMIDISDGLVSELYHLAHQSGVDIEITSMPLNRELVRFCKKSNLSPKNFALYGGEDYQLLLTGPGSKLSKIKGLIKIGRVVRTKGRTCVYLNKCGKRTVLDPLKGFKHF